MSKTNHSNHQKLKSKTWSSPDYYQKAAHGSIASHPAFNSIIQITKGKTVLEVGCGEGSKLALLQAGYAVGTDISRQAIKLASKIRIPGIVANAEKLPFKSNAIDTVVSFFVFEHLSQPEVVLQEIIRVLKPGGHLGIVAPNYGAPNRASPCFQGSRIKKLLTGFVKDFTPSQPNSLDWLPVTPRSLTEDYQMDFDTTIEPYGRSLAMYLQKQGLAIKKTHTFWDLPMDQEPPHQKLFKHLGKAGLFPFSHWGPHLLVIARKPNQ